MTVRQPPEPPHWLGPATGIPVQYEREQWPVPVPRRAPLPKLDGPADTIVSSMLIGLSFALTIAGVGVGIASQAALAALYSARGTSYFETQSASSEQTWMIASQLILFAASLALTVFLRRRKRISFYVPLVAGVIATAIFWSLFWALVLANHDASLVA